jgi:NADH-quinone oxidoreductase subunit H
MLLVTVFLGGYELPFVHPDGLTISLGATTLLHLTLPHVWVTVLQACTFFGKVLGVCWLQAFVRWSLPRFRYDQLMKLGWRVILPLSLANVFVTGCLVLVADKASPGAEAGLRLGMDLSQGLVAAVGLALAVWTAFGMLTPRRRSAWVVGSAASRAFAAGGTAESRMQA